jgi:Iron-sulfur cluster-binding domain
MRPRGAAVPARGPIRQGVIQSLLDGLGDRDDVRIVLGGFGEPCLHPALPEICTALRKCPAVASIALRTSGLFAAGRERLAEAAEDAIFETPVDVIEVMLDADTAETYHRVHGIDGWERAIAMLEKWIARREKRQQVRPLIVPSFAKSRLNVGDMEAFFDRWQRRLGTALITGYSHCAAQRADLAVTSVSPPVRTVCRRVFSRALVLADGRMTTCDQDFAGRQTVGALGHEPLEALWKSEPLSSIRQSEISRLPLCPRCDEWHRP